MKALVLTRPSEFSWQETPEPQLRKGWVRVRVRACGICGSDVHGMDGSSGRRRPPIIMGHEASGDIVDVCEIHGNWTPGDRVTFDSTIYCENCAYCRENRFNLCDNRRVLGVSCEDYRQDGAFADYVVVPEYILYALPKKVSYEQACMVEPLSIAVHALKRATTVRNSKVAVIGAGMIGLLVMQVAKAQGAAEILAIDLDVSRLETAKKFGADLTSSELPAAYQPSLVIDAAGVGNSVTTAVNGVRKGGEVILIGNLAKETTFPLQIAVTREVTILGSCASAGEYETCLKLIATGKVKVDPFISATPPMAEGAAWFQRLHAKEPGLFKVILTNR